MPDKFTQPLVSAILANFNGKKFLKQCLGSLQMQSYQNLETIFVDDGSTDGSADFVSQNFPRVRVVQNTRTEKGFAACCDTGARLAKGRYLLFLNVDIELTPDCIGSLVVRLDNDPTIGVCGPKLLSLNDRKSIVSTGGFLDIYGFGVDRGLDELDSGRYSKSEEVDFITGAVVLFRSTALWAAGGWDIDTFTYAEDSDLCWRILLTGYKVVYEPSGLAYHFQSPSMGRASPRKIHFMERNRLSSMLKNYSLSTLLRVMPGWLVIAIARITYFSTHKRIDVVSSTIKAYVNVLSNLSKIWRKRALVQSTRRLSDKEILKQFTKQSLEARLFLSDKFRIICQ